MKKTIIYLLLFACLTACNDTSNLTDEVSQDTANIMLSREYPSTIHEDETAEPVEELPEIPFHQETDISPKTNVSSSIKDKDKTINMVDCKTIDECMTISSTIENRFKDNIKNIAYIELDDKSGYYIDYTFKDTLYESLDSCNDIGKSIQESLPNHIASYECSDEYLLTIVPKEVNIK